jgi:antibiotic biosynthesis monooxygenase (ABM) superfamily enzyme
MRIVSRPEQVSFIIQHLVNPDHHEAYEEWLHRIIGEAGKFPGHMGAHVARPAKGGDLYEISVRFATRGDAERWANSTVRHWLIAELNEHIAETERLDINSGVDYWFTAATGGKSPRVWKQWLTTVSVIWPLSLVVPWLVHTLVFTYIPFLGHWGVPQLITAMATVGLLAYVIMPPYTRAIRGWLTR